MNAWPAPGAALIVIAFAAVICAPTPGLPPLDPPEPPAPRGFAVIAAVPVPCAPAVSVSVRCVDLGREQVDDAACSTAARSKERTFGPTSAAMDIDQAGLGDRAFRRKNHDPASAATTTALLTAGRQIGVLTGCFDRRRWSIHHRGLRKHRQGAAAGPAVASTAAAADDAHVRHHRRIPGVGTVPDTSVREVFVAGHFAHPGDEPERVGTRVR